MKRKLLLIGKIIGSLLVLLIIGCFSLYLYFCRTISIPELTQDSASTGSYMIVDTAQSSFWNSGNNEISLPLLGDSLYGQDAQFSENLPSYTNNGDGTISDNVTGLMWTQTLDLNGDGVIDSNDKLTLREALSKIESVNTGAYSDWRIPTIKELYSLINFNGIDPHLDQTTNLHPFIDTNYFSFGYGDSSAGERTIDAQVGTQTIYVDKTFIGFQTMFGVNFADGRIKGYNLTVSMTSIGESKFYFYYVRGNKAYGVNNFIDNGDKTISDTATNLMWSQDDSGSGMSWEEALVWVQEKNTSNYLGYSDWRLPNVKELQSIVDYSKSPATTDSAAIDSVFNITKITNENGVDDYGYFWSSTTHIAAGNRSDEFSGTQANYIMFGRGMGKMFGIWMDVHGAGAQRSELKTGTPTDYPDGFGPQGDAIRIYNYVRLVRSIQR
jgi:hypothetical protein